MVMVELGSDVVGVLPLQFGKARMVEFMQDEVKIYEITLGYSTTLRMLLREVIAKPHVLSPWMKSLLDKRLLA